MKAVRVSRIEPCTRAEGPGTRWAIWAQGCSIGCLGCCNPHTWDATAGTAVPVEDLVAKMLEAPVEGITLLGGEPFEQAEGLAAVARAAQNAGRGVMTFTGYRHQVLVRSARSDWAALLEATDLLVDGPYLRDRRDTARPWVGSSNQRFIHLTDRYRSWTFDTEQERVELRIRRDGAVAVNGWPDDRLMSALESLLSDL